MIVAPPQASLTELARWLRVEEGDEFDRLELASRWQRQPDDSPNRSLSYLVLGVIVLLVGLLFLQAALTHSTVVLGIAFIAIILAVVGAWRIRRWFWRTIFDVDARNLTVQRQGWGTPSSVILPLDSVRALTYHMDQGQLTGLVLEHTAGELALPYSGQRELDKLYCNILHHLLQKRRPEISFTAGNVIH